MSLLSGTYFPLEQLPDELKYAAYLLPLTHAVKAVRGVLQDGWSAEVTAHLSILILASLVTTNIAIYRVRSKLLK